jgi:hypothetical protein
MQLKKGLAIGPLLGLLLVLAGAAAGCAAGDDGAGVATVGGAGDNAASASPTPSPMSDEERRVKFAQCMREQGVELPDPETEGGRVAIRAPEGTDPKRVEAAMEKCRQYLPNGGERRTASPEQIEQARRLAQCMRENGVPDFPDPDPEGGLRLLASPGGRLNPNDPTFKAAREACEHLRPSGRPRTGNGGNR